MATFNSRAPRALKCGFTAVIFIFAATRIIIADEITNKIFAAQAEAEFHRAQIQFQSDPNNSTNDWQFARASFDFADFATNDAERATIAVQGIAACRQLLAREPKSAPGHYYLGMNLGQLARTELLGALNLVNEMEAEFKTAAELDKQFDHAGPARCLGLLYRDAPGWPVSIGSERKARSFLEQAEKLAPDFPENHLNLAESDLKWRDAAAAKLELTALDSLWPNAQKNFAGETWDRDWADWSARRDAAKKKIEQLTSPVKSPKK